MPAQRPAKSGESEYTMFVPWRWLTTTPASRSTLRWWLIVGWLTVQHSAEVAGTHVVGRRELPDDRKARGIGEGRQQHDVGVGTSHRAAGYPVYRGSSISKFVDIARLGLRRWRPDGRGGMLGAHMGPHSELQR